MRVRRAANRVTVANPFVVLSDVTISLSIIFLVFGIGTAISNNQLLLFFDRNDRQEAIEKQLVKAVQTVLPGATASSDPKQSDPLAHIQITSGKELLAEVWKNSSFQRVSVYEEMFPPNSSDLNAFGVRVVKEIGMVAKKNSTQFSYLFIHGITEKQEATSMLHPESVKLSQDRAWSVRQILIKQGAVGASGIELKFAIPYGIGSELYATGRRNSGRVDLVFFYGDRGGIKDDQVTGKSADGRP